MRFSVSILFFLAATLVEGAPHKSSKICVDYDIPLTVTSENFIFGPRFADNFDVVDFFQNLTSRTAATDFNPFTGKENQTASYTVSGTFYTAKDGSAAHKKTVLVATHGLNADKKYSSTNQLRIWSFCQREIATGTLEYSRINIASLILLLDRATQFSTMTDLEMASHQCK